MPCIHEKKTSIFFVFFSCYALTVGVLGIFVVVVHCQSFLSSFLLGLMSVLGFTASVSQCKLSFRDCFAFFSCSQHLPSLALPFDSSTTLGVCCISLCCSCSPCSPSHCLCANLSPVCFHNLYLLSLSLVSLFSFFLN